MSKNQPRVDNPVRIIAACRDSDGGPGFAAVVVDCTPAAVRDGVHFELASAALGEFGYQEPYIFFDHHQAPKWLTDNVVTVVDIAHVG